MPVQFEEWGSTTETEGPLVCEGITQQPGSFYNGNFSSSIWGNPPTPPLWRDMLSTNASCSSSRGQPFGFPSSDKQTTESVISCKPSDKQEEKVSKWLEDFSFRQQARPQESLNSPFSFGFPSTPPAPQPYSSSICDQGTLNGSSYSQSHCAGGSADVNVHSNSIKGDAKMFDKGSSQGFTQATTFSLKDLAFLKEGVKPIELSYGNPFADLSVHGLAFSKEGVKPIQHSCGNPFAEANDHAASLHKQQSSHPFIGISSGGGPNLEQCNLTPPLFSQKTNSSTFIFGSCPASGTSVNVGFSLQKDALAAGSMPRSSVTKSKVKKHNNFVKMRDPTAPVSKASQPDPSESSTGPSHSSNPGLNFTMRMSDADSQPCSKLVSKTTNSTYSDWEPASSLQNPRASVQKVSSSFGANTAGVQNPLFVSGAASSKGTDSVASLSEGYSSQQRSKSQHAQTFGEQFDTWHPFLQREEKSGLDRDFVGVALRKETSYPNTSDKKQGKWEASEKATFFYEELPKSSPEVNTASEGSKLAEFNMNSPGKLSVEDLRERAAKWGRSGEEIRRQKENQEPNFIFGSQKASRPFVFGASRTSGSMKHATASTDNVSKNEITSKEDKESKVLEHLVAKLGEEMADLGKSYDTESNYAACTGKTAAEGINELSAYECSSDKFCERLAMEEIFYKEVKKKATNRSQDAVNIVKKNMALNHSIDELREQLAKLGSFDNPLDKHNDVTDSGRFSSSEGARYRNSMEHAVKELSEEITKLGNFDEKREENTRAKTKCSGSAEDQQKGSHHRAKCSASEDQQKSSHDSSAVEHAVEELRAQIAKLGRAARDNTQDTCSASILQQSEVFEQSVEKLCERMVSLGNTAERGNSHDSDQESNSTHDQKKVQEAFAFSAYNATAQKESDSTGFHWSKAFAGSNGAGFINTAQLNPFATASHFNLFPCNAFIGPQSSSSFSSVNPFTAGQPTPCAEAYNGVKFSVGPQYSSRLSTVNPFAAGQPPPFAEAHNGAKFSATANPFTAGKPTPYADAHNGAKFSATANPFAAGQPTPCAEAHNGAKVSATVNPFTVGQPTPCAEAHNGAKVSVGPQYSSPLAMVNPFAAGQPPPFAEAHNGAKFSAMANPFTAGQPTPYAEAHNGAKFSATVNPFTAGQPTPCAETHNGAKVSTTVNPFTARQSTPCAEAHIVAEFSVGPQYSSSFCTVNPFTAGQPTPCAEAHNGTKLSAGPEYSSSFSTVNPFTAGQPPPFAEAHNGAKFSAMVNPFTAGQPSPCAEAHNEAKFSFGPQYSSPFSTENPFTAGQSPPFAEAHNGAKFSATEIPSASNDTGEGSSHQGFEFHGTKKPISGTTMQSKNGRSRFNVRSHENGNLTRLRTSSVLHGKVHDTSTAHNVGSPMDFSPCADKCAPSSPNNGSGEPQHTPVQKSPELRSVEAESMNVEEIRKATSNLTVGNKDGSSHHDQKESRSFEHSSAETNPFVLRQTKGRWKRAPRIDTGACGINRKQAEEHVQKSFLGEEFNFSSFSPLADPHGVGAREKSLRNTTLNQGSVFSANEKGEKSAQKASSKKTSQTFRFSKLDTEQKATNIAREVPSSPNVMRSAAAEEVCEKWRKRGNQAYAKGDYKKAEDCYTRGAGSVSPEDTSQSCIRASMLCYSNRAATRMAVGRMKEALADCQRAMMLDSSFLRVRLRAASCYLALGESSAAAALFADCWKCAKETGSFDMKIIDEAMDGVKKSQQFDDLLERALKLCQGETSTDASAALHPLKEALLISPFSEALLELKAKALFSLRRFEDALQLCQQTLPAAEENHIVKQDHEQSMHKDVISLNLWRWRMCGKSLFHLGKLEESSSLLTKYEEATCSISFNRAASTESVGAILINIRDLLHHKAAGNEAFQAGRHAEAVEHYTAALACSGESRPYNAVCFCNRAAASQALGHIPDAIADCSRAIVLDSHYAKAISRRATLHEIIRDYGQSCNDLGRLIALLEGQEAHSKSPKSTRAVSKNAQDLRQARDRLEKATEELKKGCAVDHYLILGLDVSCSSNDIKKAYRKAALKHHPDKAGQFLVRGENGDDGSLWKEVGDEVRRDAERLFKLIGESYAILSDPTKRAQYDVDNHMSRARNYPEHGSAEDYRSPFEKSSRRQRERRDGWSGYSPRYQRWQNGPDAAQPDTYSERNTHDSSGFKDSRNRGRTDFYWSEY